MNYSLYAYAWDVLDDNAMSALLRLKDAGIDSMSVAFSYHAGKFILPWHSRQRVIFPEDGTVYFEPDPRLYAELQPRQATCSRGVNIVEMLRQQFDLPTRAWTVLLHNTRLGQLHPECTVSNAFGDRYVYSLCPANPAVVHYAVALCRDIAAQGVAGLKLETPGYLPYAHGFHHEFSQLPGNSWMENLLGLCFCRHCKAHAQRREIDADGLQRWVAKALGDYFASPSDISEVDADKRWLDCLAEHEVLKDFLSLRIEIVNDLLRGLRKATSEVNDAIELAVIPTVQRPHSKAYYEGSDFGAQSRIAGRLELPLYQNSAAACVADAEYVIRQVQDPRCIGAIVRPGPPDMVRGEQLTQTLIALARLNISDFSFYNFGLLSPGYHDWICSTLLALEQHGSNHDAI